MSSRKRRARVQESLSQGDHSRFPDFKFNPSLDASDRTRRVVFFIWNSGKQEGTAVSWNRGADCNSELKFDITIRCCLASAISWQSHAEPGAARPLAAAAGASDYAPPAVAEYQPGYDGLPGGAQGLRALPPYRLRTGLCWFDKCCVARAIPWQSHAEPVGSR